MKCKYCNKEVGKTGFNQHLKAYHSEEYNQQVQLIKQLFFDDNFSEITINNYPDIVLSYNAIRNLWKQMYNDDQRKERMKRCTALHNKGKNTNRVPSTIARQRMSLSRIKYLKQHPHKLAVSGFRPDIGHNANSTYEANIYRIFQKEKKNYKRETENIFPIVFPDQSIHNYIIDICDIDGLFAAPGTFIEIKGYMDERSLLKINCFKRQYPQYNLIIIGNKYQKNYQPDIDYRQLENKYKVQIPLWETSHDNIKTNPQKWSIDNTIQNDTAPSSIFYCPECGPVSGKRIWTHIKHFHPQLYMDIIKLIKELFKDANFLPHTYDQYKDKLYGVSYSSIRRQWEKIFGKKRVAARLKKLIPKKNKQPPKAFVNCPICGKIHSKWLLTHIKNNHKVLYEEIINLIKELFYDANYVQDNSEQYKDKLYGISYSAVYAQWRILYGKALVAQRTKILQGYKPLNNIKKNTYCCPICNQSNITRMANHIKYNHPDKYKELIDTCNKIFYDSNFTEASCKNYPELYNISFNTVKRQWIKTYGKSAVSNRSKIININNK